MASRWHIASYHKSCFDSDLTQSFPSPLLTFDMSIKDHDPSSTGSDAADAEKVDFTEPGNEPPNNSLKRQLKNRHITMIR